MMFFRKSFRRSRSSKTEKYRPVKTTWSATGAKENGHSSTDQTDHLSTNSPNKNTVNNNKDSPHQLNHHHNDSFRDSTCHNPIPLTSPQNQDRGTGNGNGQNHSCQNPIASPHHLNHHHNTSYRNSSCSHSPIHVQRSQDEFTVNSAPCTMNRTGDGNFQSSSSSQSNQQNCNCKIDQISTQRQGSHSHSCTISKNGTDNQNQSLQNCYCDISSRNGTLNNHRHKLQDKDCIHRTNDTHCHSLKQRQRDCRCPGGTSKYGATDNQSQAVHNKSCILSKSKNRTDDHSQTLQKNCSCIVGKHGTADNHSQGIHSNNGYISSKSYHWQQNGQDGDNSHSLVCRDISTTITTTATKSKMVKTIKAAMATATVDTEDEDEEEDEDIENLFHQCFSNKQWQNAVLYTVVKTSLTNPELKTSIRREGDRNYQGRLHRRLSSGISNFYQLLEVHRMESRKGEDPDLMSLSHVLRYDKIIKIIKRL